MLFSSCYAFTNQIHTMEMNICQMVDESSCLLPAVSVASQNPTTEDHTTPTCSSVAAWPLLTLRPVNCQFMVTLVSFLLLLGIYRHHTDILSQRVARLETLQETSLQTIGMKELFDFRAEMDENQHHMLDKLGKLTDAVMMKPSPAWSGCACTGRSSEMHEEPSSHGAVEKEQTVTSCQPANFTLSNPGYNDRYAGWYDPTNCGICNHYCRWIDGKGSGGNPNKQTRHGQSRWSCQSAEDSKETDYHFYGNSFGHRKCEYRNERRANADGSV